jgi:hypothetical protein
MGLAAVKLAKLQRLAARAAPQTSLQRGRPIPGKGRPGGFGLDIQVTQQGGRSRTLSAQGFTEVWTHLRTTDELSAGTRSRTTEENK